MGSVNIIYHWLCLISIGILKVINLVFKWSISEFSGFHCTLNTGIHKSVK